MMRRPEQSALQDRIHLSTRARRRGISLHDRQSPSARSPYSLQNNGGLLCRHSLRQVRGADSEIFNKFVPASSTTGRGIMRNHDFVSELIAACPVTLCAGLPS
jgi:hypothetical protein